MRKEELLGKGVYLDNAATSFPKPEAVMQEMMAYMRENGATSSRGAYRKAMLADRKIYEARKEAARLFHCPNTSSVVFSINITEALNLALQGILDAGDHVVTSSMEHNAVWRCLKTLERDRGNTITKVPADEQGNTRPEDVEKYSWKYKTDCVYACL